MYLSSERNMTTLFHSSSIFGGVFGLFSLQNFFFVGYFTSVSVILLLVIVRTEMDVRVDKMSEQTVEKTKRQNVASSAHYLRKKDHFV
jgi:hypothetical protein